MTASITTNHDQVTDGKNNFDGVRICLALIVVFAHMATLTQAYDFKYFNLLFDSNFAVKGFFAISGFLVTKSYLSSRSTLEYAEKRFRRIYPAYTAAIALCISISLFCTTSSLSEFFQSPQTLKYIFANLTFLNFIQPTLPGTFETNPVQALNGSLWTIKVEVMLYFWIPALVYFSKRIGSATSILIVFFISVAWVYFFTFQYGGSGGDEIARQFPGQLSYFSLGILFAVNKKIICNITLVAILSLIALLVINNPIARLIIDPIAYSSIIIYLSTAAFKSQNFGKLGDISYGIYLYHFPIIQLLVFIGLFHFNAWMGMLATLALTITMAFSSWHLIEKRFLKRSSHYVLATAK